MDLRVPTLIKFLNRLKSGTAAGNKSYLKGESEKSSIFGILFESYFKKRKL